MISNETEMIVMQAFQMPSFSVAWDVIDQAYKSRGLGSSMTDEEKIEEYSYIAKQMNKYISRVQPTILKNGASDLKKILEAVEECISGADEYSQTRSNLMYCFMRDSWLQGLYGTVFSMMIDNEEDE